MTSLPILLADGFSLRVNAGDTVKPGDLLAERKIINEISVDLSKQLRIPKSKAKKYLKKNPGDSISPGDILAKKQGFLSQDEIISSAHGTVVRFERDTGRMVVLVSTPKESFDTVNDGTTERIVSPIDGIVDLCDNDQILLKTDKDVIVGERGQGRDIEGELYVITPESLGDATTLKKIQIHDLNADCIGKIVIGEEFDRDALTKAIGMGVLGILGVKILEQDLLHIKERKLTTPIIQISSSDYLKLLQWNKRKIYMQGNTKSILFLHL